MLIRCVFFGDLTRKYKDVGGLKMELHIVKVIRYIVLSGWHFLINLSLSQNHNPKQQMISMRMVSHLLISVLILGWDFPATLSIAIGDRRINTYRLVARIMSQSSSGVHFTTLIRTSDDMVFSVDGMAQYKHTGIRQISKFNARGYATRINSSKDKSSKKLERITGRKKFTIAVFYVLENTTEAKQLWKQDFFHQQQKVLARTPDRGIFRISPGGQVSMYQQFDSNYLNYWTLCIPEDITWREKISTILLEFKVLSI